MTPEHDALAAHEWEVLLTRLEVRLNRAERMLSTLLAEDLADLEMAEPLSTMPRYLMPRAQALLERQQQLAQRLPEMVERSRRQGPLHERVGHLVSGPREPLPYTFFEDAPAG